MRMLPREQRAEDDVGRLDPRDAHVHELVASRARERPAALAVTAGADSLAYGDLDRRANRLANLLRALGVGPDVLVGLCLPRSLEMVVAALAILKAGGAYVPMDPAYPLDRLAFMLEDAGSRVWLATKFVAERFVLRTPEVVRPDDPRIAAYPDDAPRVDVTSGNLAYVIYTSGSTGKPKGVEITHGGLANLVWWHRNAFSTTAADRASHVAGLGFDAAVWELWPYLAAGASVHLCDDASRNSAELLHDWLLSRSITLGFVPTPLFERLLTLRWPRNTELRTVLTGGDVLHRYPPPDLPFRVVNNYGPTECTVVATSGPVLPQPSPTTLPSIGRAIANVQIHLLDEHLRPVPVGAPGEIYVGGAALARGYHDRPELTAERFVRNPFAGESGSRLYRTGDLGRLLPNGQITFLGRMDDQIKIRGFRIEPAEISSTLDRHPAIRASLVVARDDTAGDKRLVAYVVADSDTALTHSGLREFLGSSLPEHMLPAVFVRIAAFPLTPHGKIDRVALPAPDSTNVVQDPSSEAPRTATEQRVAKILGELLNLDQIGVDDNFFMLGGHSLLGAQVVARLRDDWGVEMDLRSLFEAPTVAELSSEVERLVREKDAPTDVERVAG